MRQDFNMSILSLKFTKLQVLVVFYMVLNFASSVMIIWANKIAFNLGYKWTIIMTAFHFFVTYIGLECCAFIVCRTR